MNAEKNIIAIGATINSHEMVSPPKFGFAIACSMLKHSFWEKQLYSCHPPGLSAIAFYF
jgi:hypothetical protein